MINKQGLNKIIDLVQRGEQILPGEIAILREAIDLLDDLAGTLDKIMNGHGSSIMLRGFEPETTQQLKIIEQGKITRDDDHRGNRP
jgi:hypothetical protein